MLSTIETDAEHRVLPGGISDGRVALLRDRTGGRKTDAEHRVPPGIYVRWNVMHEI